MVEVPDYLKEGDVARLIPVVADTSKEVRATSILLAIVMSVDKFAGRLLETVGQRIGTRASINCYTEVVFNKRPSDAQIRPDGLITLRVGKRHWSAILEAKIGKADLEEAKISEYCQLAKLNGVDAVITVSNQFTALPTHHPVKLRKKAPKGVALYHWSWMSVLTEAMLLLEEHEFQAPEQEYMLKEMVRYFQHDSTGVSTFVNMNPEWKDLVGKVHRGGALNKTATEVENSVAAWHQEQRDLCLLMSRKLGRPVALKLPSAQRGNQEKRLKDDCERLSKNSRLVSVLDVPDAAASIEVIADVRGRTISCGMWLAAPKDKTRSRSRINWVVKQLSKADAPNIIVKALWPGRAVETTANLLDLRENPTLLDGDNPKLIPQSFEVLMVKDLASKFAGRRTFIEQLEALLPEYYEQVAEHLRAWVPPPPKIKEDNIETAEDHAVSTSGLSDTNLEQ